MRTLLAAVLCAALVPTASAQQRGPEPTSVEAPSARAGSAELRAHGSSDTVTPPAPCEAFDREATFGRDDQPPLERLLRAALEEGRQSVPAAERYLMRWQRLAAPARRTACAAKLRSDLYRLDARHCVGLGARPAPRLCADVERLRCGLGRRDAQTLLRLEQPWAAATLYLSMAERCTEMADELRYNAAVAYESVDAHALAIEAWVRLIEEHPSSALTERATWQLAVLADQLGETSRAADAYTRFAERYPGRGPQSCAAGEPCPDAVLAHERALALHLGLRDFASAIEDAHRFDRHYGPRRAARGAQLFSDLCASLAEAGEWRRVRRVAQPWLVGHHEPSPARDQVRFVLARAYGETGSPGRARSLLTELARVDDPHLELRPTDQHPMLATARLAHVEPLAQRLLSRRAPRSNQDGWLSARRAELDTIRRLVNPIAALASPRHWVRAAALLGRLERHLAEQANDHAMRQSAVDRFAFCVARADQLGLHDGTSTECRAALHELEPAP